MECGSSSECQRMPLSKTKCPPRKLGLGGPRRRGLRYVNVRLIQKETKNGKWFVIRMPERASVRDQVSSLDIGLEVFGGVFGGLGGGSEVSGGSRRVPPSHMYV
jgi:hypothetical protein